MQYKIGDYISATMPSVINGAGNSLHIVGTITEIDKEGKITLTSGAVIYPEHAEITVHGENVVSITVINDMKRQEAMRQHPAGKGLNHEF